MPKRGKCISFDYGRTRRQRSNFAALLFIVAAPNHSTAKTKAIIQIVSAAELIMNYGSFYFAGWSTLNAKALSNLFHALLVSFDHLLDHLSADGTGSEAASILKRSSASRASGTTPLLELLAIYFTPLTF